ncbi:MAG: hypothetical protein OXC41_09875 [Gammaproteobacteria bacterium]|nr:hypothetical protein [Gammaproteobacteria bacterium]
MTDSKKQAKKLLHDCDRCARYHSERRTFFDVWNKVILVGIVFLNSGAVATISIDQTNWKWAMGLTLISPLLVAINLVFDLTNKARNHEFLSRRFHALEMSIDVDEASEEKVREWRKCIYSIYEDEPATYYALNAICYNDATQALGYSKKFTLSVTSGQRRLRHWVKYSATDFDQPNLA